MKKQIPLSQIERFDMNKKPIRQRLFLLPVAWAMSFPAVIKHKAKLKRIGMEGIKPPYLLLQNHNSFLDFKVTTAAVFPHRASYVVAIDGFLGREWLLRNVGCICKRKFTNDITMVRHLKRSANAGDVVVVYPEARYSLCGTNAVLPESMGKLAKFLGIPVVSLITHGHHVHAPFWNLHERGNRVEAEMTLLATAEETKTLSAQALLERIENAFQYDDFAWQYQNRVAIPYAKRAEGLHKVLYQCPACKKEYEMRSEGTELYCDACKKRWEMDEYGRLSAKTGETEFYHIPDWYEWERENVRNEVAAGAYALRCSADILALPNAKRFIPLGEAEFVHDANGFSVRGTYCGEAYEMIKPVSSLYSCHIEYDYLGKYGDLVDLNTLTDTFYCRLKGAPFSVTKIALATEELYRLDKELREEPRIK